MHILELDAKDWGKEVVQSSILTVVYFFHEKCPWCHDLDPMINLMAEEYVDRIKFIKINVLSSKENFATAIRHGIRSIPALDFFYNVRHIETVTGFVQEDHLRHILDEVLATHKERAKRSLDLNERL